MENILKEINAVMGVTGCFVCNNDGEIISSTLPAQFDETSLSNIGLTMLQTIAGMEKIRRRKVGDIVLVFKQYSFIAKNFGDGCLYIFGARNINVALLNLTANLAVKRLSEKIKTTKPTEKKVKPLETDMVLSGSSVNGTFFTQFEYELTRVMGPVAPFIIENELIAMSIERESFPQDRLPELLEKVGNAIADAGKKANFLEIMHKISETLL